MATTASAQAAESLSLGAYLAEWLAHMRSRVRPRTFAGYEALIRVHAVPGLGHIQLQALGPLDIQGLYTERLRPEHGLSPGTVLNLHLVLTNALGQAERWGLITRNPARGAQPPRPDRPEPVVVDPALAELLLQSGRRHHRGLPRKVVPEEAGANRSRPVAIWVAA